MITALVIIAVFCIGAVAGNMWGSRATRESMLDDFDEKYEEIEVQAGKNLLEEMLEHPDTSLKTKDAVASFTLGTQERPLTDGFKFVKGKGAVPYWNEDPNYVDPVESWTKGNRTPKDEDYRNYQRRWSKEIDGVVVTITDEEYRKLCEKEGVEPMEWKNSAW